MITYGSIKDSTVRERADIETFTITGVKRAHVAICGVNGKCPV